MRCVVLAEDTGSSWRTTQNRRRRGAVSAVLFSRRRWMGGAATTVMGWLLTINAPGDARVPTESLVPLNRLPYSRDRFSKDRENSSRRSDVQSAVASIQEWTADAEKASASGHYQQVSHQTEHFCDVTSMDCQALDLYTRIVQSYPDLAVTEYARLHRALLLYEVGDVRRSLLELDDLEVSLRGFPEVHAALASLLYIERPLQISRAESQWDLATSFDRRFADLAWVQRTKKWPPRVLDALERFLDLR